MDDVHYTVLLGHTGPVTCCALNSDETRLASASRDMVYSYSEFVFCLVNQQWATSLFDLDFC